MSRFAWQVCRPPSAPVCTTLRAMPDAIWRMSDASALR